MRKSAIIVAAATLSASSLVAAPDAQARWGGWGGGWGHRGAWGGGWGRGGWGYGGYRRGWGGGALAAGIAGAAVGGLVASSYYPAYADGWFDSGYDAYPTYSYGNGYYPTYAYGYDPGYAYGYPASAIVTRRVVYAPAYRRVAVYRGYGYGRGYATYRGGGYRRAYYGTRYGAGYRRARFY
jgi:hypothetical protein